MGIRNLIDFVRLQRTANRKNSALTNQKVVDSRNGALYCQICDDLVWDPTLEELRLRKIGTGSFSGILHKLSCLLKQLLTLEKDGRESTTSFSQTRLKTIQDIFLRILRPPRAVRMALGEYTMLEQLATKM